MSRKWISFHKHISRKLLGQFISNLARVVEYMEGIKYMNLIEIGPLVIEIQGVKNSKLVVPVITHLCATRHSWPLTHDSVSWSNTLVFHTASLAADTQPCLDVYVLYTQVQFCKQSRWPLASVHPVSLSCLCLWFWYACIGVCVCVFVCVSEWVYGYMHGCVGECMHACVCVPAAETINN